MPIDCFPKVDDLDVTKPTKRVSFAPSGQPSKVPVDLPMIETEDQSINEQRDKDLRVGSPVPPPGFRRFEWPQAEWTTNSDINRDPGLKFVASWSAKIAEEEGLSPPPLEQLSPIPGENSQDSVTVQVGTTDSEVHTPIVLDRIRSIHRRRSRRPMTRYSTSKKSPTPAEDFLFKDILCAEALITKRPFTRPTSSGDRETIPRWRLAREGPFPNERSRASLRVLGKGCAFRHTTHSA